MLDFKRNRDREEIGFRNVSDFRTVPLSLFSYFRSNERKSLNPSQCDQGSDDFLSFAFPWKDGVYRQLIDDGDRTWPGSNWLELSYEKQCETVDILPIIAGALLEGLQVKDTPTVHGSKALEKAGQLTKLIEEGDFKEATAVLWDLLEEVGLSDRCLQLMEAGRMAIAYRSWCSNNWEQHVSSIEGDYALFDAFEHQWLQSQERVPRHWTRMGLSILLNTQELYSPSPYEPVDKPTWEEIEDYCTANNIKPVAIPSKEQWKLVEDLIKILDVQEGDLSPSLIDFFC